ncbi:hypothetical protein [Nocardia cyriacigeorgica]|uniref:hypothetical protein n=1 Tax=Nocardia cyriacigeorgica TaxID=135487 RepID=UPI001895F672|nr:hypothetical protein [Nocardia cyriacigeorgica]MBF6289987.1 hypothetical protein [Nocardia cyriacigeorgica]
MTAGTGTARRHRVIGQGNHSTVYHRPGSPVVMQVFFPDAPELTVAKVRREYLYLRAIFDPVLPGLIPNERMMLPAPAARLCETVVVKDFVQVAPAWSLRIAARHRLPRQTLDQLAVFTGVVRDLLADTTPVPALHTEASLIPDFIDPPMDNLVVDTAGQLRLLDTNRLISTLELRRRHHAGQLLTVACDDTPARIYRLVFRRLMFLEHRFLRVPAARFRTDPLITRYLHPAQIEALFTVNRPDFRSYREPCPAVAGRPDSRSA